MTEEFYRIFYDVQNISFIYIVLMLLVKVIKV